MTLQLFDKIARTDYGPAGESEPKYQYLNRSARKPFARIRVAFQEWFDRFPLEAKHDLMRRFQSREERQHFGAFFELYCHELLRRHGFVVEVHPGGKGEGETRPDFLASQNGMSLFYLEATVVSGPEDRSSSNAREAQVVEEINRLPLADFFVSLHFLRTGSKTPSMRRIRKSVLHEAALLDANAATRNNRMPKFRYRDGDWLIQFGFIPKKPESRGETGGRAVGLIMGGGGGFMETETWLHDAALRKVRKYRDLELPLVVAVNSISGFADAEDVPQALFGNPAEGDTIRDFLHPREGSPALWLGAGGLRHTRMSALLFSLHLLPWTIGSVTPVLWHHPGAKTPFERSWWQLPQIATHPDTGQLERVAGKQACDLLDVDRQLLADDPRPE